MVACGGGDDDDTATAPDTASFSLAISDAPVDQTNVNYNEGSESYEFVAGYLPAGPYTVGFSCLALNDKPETDENADVFSFQAVVETAVSATEQTNITIE